MAARTFGQEVVAELGGKAIVWGPAIAIAILLGPLGILLGLGASAGIVASISGNSPEPRESEPPNDQSKDAAGRQ